MEKNDRNRCIALAALFQAASLANQLAYEGDAQESGFLALLHSIFDNRSPAIEDIYQGLANLDSGFELVSGLLTNPGEGVASMNITRYTIGLLHLAKKLEKSPQIGKQMIQDIEDIERQIQFFGGESNPAIISRLADIYKQYISPLQPQIIIKGERDHLDNPDVAARIRAMLLAGIRAAVLWRQAGGNRFTLMLRRRKLVEQARQLRRSLPTRND